LRSPAARCAKACRFWEARCPELPRACRFAIRAARAQRIAELRHAACASRAPLRFRCARTLLAPAHARILLPGGLFMQRASTLMLAGLTLTAAHSLGCWAVHNREGDRDRSPVVNTGAGASIIYPGQAAPPHPGNYHPREAGYGQGVLANPNGTTVQSRNS